MIIKNIEPSVLYDQVVKKLDAVGAFVFEIVCLVAMYLSVPQYIIFYIVLFTYSVFSFLGKIFGTIFSMLIMSKDKKN